MSQLLSKGSFLESETSKRKDVTLEKLGSNKWPSTELIFRKLWLVEGD